MSTLTISQHTLDRWINNAKHCNAIAIAVIKHIGSGEFHPHYIKTVEEIKAVQNFHDDSGVYEIDHIINMD